MTIYIGDQPIYTQGVRYVGPWPTLPEPPSTTYRIESPHWSGEIAVRDALVDHFGEERAVPFTLWGYMLIRHGEELEKLFTRYGRHEVRRAFVGSIRYERAR